MARDICIREECWGWEEVIGYEPVEGKRLLVWPDSLCLPPEPCNIDDKDAKDAIEYYRSLREDYGFTLLFLYPSYCSNHWAAKAGWRKDQIVVAANGSDLLNLSFISDVFDNYWNDYWKGTKDPPPFHGVYIDEPWNAPKYPVIEYKWGGKDIDTPFFPTIDITKDFIKELCDKKCWVFYIQNDHFRNSYKVRFYLISIYIHECMNTQLTICAYSTMWNNYWRDVHALNDYKYKVESSDWDKWIDSIMYTKYKLKYGEELTELGLVDQWELIKKAGISGNRVWISLQENEGELDTLFKEINNLQFNEVWLFPQDEGKRTWHTCNEYKKRLEVFRDAAARAGFLRKVTRKHRKCVFYEIPGCREGIRRNIGSYLDYNPFIRDPRFF